MSLGKAKYEKFSYTLKAWDVFHEEWLHDTYEIVSILETVAIILLLKIQIGRHPF